MTLASQPPTLPDPVERYDEEGVRDFSAPRKTVVFRMDGDLFHGVPDLPGDKMLELTERFVQVEQMKVGDPAMRQLLHEQIELVLTQQSAERYLTRMGDREDPISLTQTLELIPWILEQYGLRPTQPSSPSAAGSPSEDAGTNSAAGPYSPGSTPRDYLRRASST